MDQEIFSVSDRFKLSRFIEAQEDVYDDVLEELKHGKKTGHWIWYIFPQVSGLGHSEMSERYSISCIKRSEGIYCESDFRIATVGVRRSCHESRREICRANIWLP